MPTTSDSAIYNPAAYGSVPIIPDTSTNVSTSESTWSPNLPNYDALASAASMISQNQMAGQLNPQDLANAQQWSAERGVGTGTGFGSPNNMAAYQQFLGLSAQKLEQQGLTNYEGLLAGAPRTTDTTGTQTTDNNVLKAEYAAAPNPYAAAMANLAAQRAGLAGGAGAGVSQGSGTAAALRAAQQAAALAGMGGQGAPSVWSSGTGPQGGAPAQSAGAGSSGEQYGAFGGILDAQGNEWISFGDGSSMNIDTGEIRYQSSGGDSGYGYQPTTAGSMYMGSQAGYGGSGQSPIYGQDIYDPNNSIFGGSGAGGGIDQTVYNPATDQSQYNYGIPDYYGGQQTAPEYTGNPYDPYADSGGGGWDEFDWSGVMGG